MNKYLKTITKQLKESKMKKVTIILAVAILMSFLTIISCGGNGGENFGELSLDEFTHQVGSDYQEVSVFSGSINKDIVPMNVYKSAIGEFVDYYAIHERIALEDYAYHIYIRTESKSSIKNNLNNTSLYVTKEIYDKTGKKICFYAYADSGKFEIEVNGDTITFFDAKFKLKDAHELENAPDYFEKWWDIITDYVPYCN